MAVANPCQQVAFLLVASGVQNGQASQHHGGKEGAGAQGTPHFLQQYGQVKEVAAGAAVGLREYQPGPAQSGHLFPQVIRVAAGVFLHGPHQAQRALLRQKALGTGAKHLLDFTKPEIHVQASWNGYLVVS